MRRHSSAHVSGRALHRGERQCRHGGAVEDEDACVVGGALEHLCVPEVDDRFDCLLVGESRAQSLAVVELEEGAGDDEAEPPLLRSNVRPRSMNGT